MMSQRIWPNFYIVGAVKSGTTSLYAYLRQHPQVFLPTMKEPHFFTRPHPSPEQTHLIQYVANVEQYQHLYRGANQFPRIGDASPSYLWCEEAPERIHAVQPDARIIVILRDPVQRAYAQYLMDFNEGVLDLPFMEALQRDWTRSDKGWGISQLYVELGRYTAQIIRYQQRFGADHVHVCLLEDLKKTPLAVLEGIADFLDIDRVAMRAIDLGTAHNAHRLPRGNWARRLASGRMSRFIGEHLFPHSWGEYIWRHIFLREGRKPPMDSAARRFLQELYAPEIERLEHLLNRPLPELRVSWKAFEPIKDAKPSTLPQKPSGNI
jgi:hypothetical protein